MSTVYEIVTDRILEMLEQGTAPWRRPWATIVPRNLVSKKAYRGINVLMLSSSKYASPFWLTYKQAKDLGGNVRKGEKGSMVVFWKWREREVEPDADTESAEGASKQSAPILRYYYVFNVEQCEGIKAPERAGIPADATAEDVIEKMPARPRVEHGGNQAFYSPTLDYIQMPPRNSFESREAYYRVMFHELTHSTGHPARLNRFENLQALAPFGSTDYSKEELTAEIGSAMLCAETGIEHNLEASAAYVANWLQVLKNDKRMVVFAAARAQKAVDFILARKSAEGGAR